MALGDAGYRILCISEIQKSLCVHHIGGAKILQQPGHHKTHRKTEKSSLNEITNKEGLIC